MPLDPTIAMGVRPVEIQNPLDSAVKALTMRELMQRSQSNALSLQAQQREASDQTAMRDAYKNNLVKNPDGSTSINRQGVIASLNQQNPLLAGQAQMGFQKMDLEQMKMQQDAAKNILFTMNDPQSYAAGIQKMQQLGLPNSNKWPAQYDPSIVRHAQISSLTAEEQLAQANKQVEQTQKSQEMDLKRQDMALQRQKYGGEQVQQTMQALQSARGNPAVQQAEKDVYANEKVNSLVAQAKDKNGNVDPNALNNTQIRLLAGEVGKIATGGAPTMDELHGLTPGNVPQELSTLAEKVRNKPTPANAGEFVTALQNYSNSVAKDAKGLLYQNNTAILESKKKYLSPDEHQNFKQLYVDRYADKSGDQKDYGHSLAQGTTKEYGGKTYRVVGGQWVADQSQAAK